MMAAMMGGASGRGAWSCGCERERGSVWRWLLFVLQMLLLLIERTSQRREGGDDGA